MRAEPEPRVIAWVDDLDASETCITTITAAELLHGVALLPIGRRRTRLAETVQTVLDDDFGERVLSFDLVAAAHYADIAAHRSHLGRPISHADAQIAAVCRSHAATLATRNVADFDETGLTIVDPWAPPT